MTDAYHHTFYYNGSSLYFILPAIEIHTSIILDDVKIDRNGFSVNDAIFN